MFITSRRMVGTYKTYDSQVTYEIYPQSQSRFGSLVQAGHK